MTNNNKNLTKKEDKEKKLEYRDCAIDIHNKILDILENDLRGDISSRIYYIGKTIARRQSSDIDMASALRILIDAFNDELIIYKGYLDEENAKIENSLATFKASKGDEEVINLDDINKKKKTIN